MAATRASAVKKTAARSQKDTSSKQKFKILDHRPIQVEYIHDNLLNPRPGFHFDDENPELKSMGDSIRIEGLHNPIRVYEIPEDVGQYRVVQGHRRLKAARLAGVGAVECLIYEAPTSEEQEFEMLGCEDAHKRSWSQSGLFQMKYASELAEKMGLDTCAHPDMVTKTGLSMHQLQIASKVFKLEKPIIGLVVAYEEALYEQLLNGQRKKGSRLAGSGVRVVEFPPERAALVWDLFIALRTHAKMAVKKYSDLDLQHRLAQSATGPKGTEALRNAVMAVKGSSRGHSPGLMANIDDLLSNPQRKISDLVRTSGNTHIVRLAKVGKLIEALDVKVAALARNTNGMGGDIDLLRETDRSILRLVSDLQDLERKLDRMIRDYDAKDRR